MGWGHKAIEIRSAETGHLDGVFMHKKAQKLKFLCERNDKVRSQSAAQPGQLASSHDAASSVGSVVVPVVQRGVTLEHAEYCCRTCTAMTLLVYY